MIGRIPGEAQLGRAVSGSSILNLLIVEGSAS